MGSKHSSVTQQNNTNNSNSISISGVNNNSPNTSPTDNNNDSTSAVRRVRLTAVRGRFYPLAPRPVSRRRRFRRTFNAMCTALSPNDEGSSVVVHRLSNNPTLAWESIRNKQKVIKLNVSSPTTPASDDVLRFVCLSDTHSLAGRMTQPVPRGDVLLHAGDFTRCGDENEIKDFNTWLGQLPHQHKLVIAGNHELSFDPSFNDPTFVTTGQRARGSRKVEEISPLSCSRDELIAAVNQSDPRRLLTNATYLEDELVTIAGVGVYGTPWQPVFLNWAFNLPRGSACLEKWAAIPAGVDVVLSHGPPLGHGDLCCTGVRAGCMELLTTLQQRVKPKYSVFGHIHEGYGITTDGSIVYVNASTCDINYSPRNAPIVFDVKIPPGHSKDWLHPTAPKEDQADSWDTPVMLPHIKNYTG